MDKKRIFALLIATTILTTIATPLAPPTPTQHQAQIPLTRNPITPPQTQWNKTYGGTKMDGASSVRQTSDGGYIVAGNTVSFGAGMRDFWLVKMDGSGSHQWNKTYGGTDFDAACCVQRTIDGGYILAGRTLSYGAGNNDFWLVKTDSSGNKQWSETYGGSSGDEASSVQQTSDEGYILAGYTYSFGAGDYDWWLVKTDSAGNKQWSRTYGGADDDKAYSVEQTSDGGYIMAGYTVSFGAGGTDFWLVKTDSRGNQQWSKTYGGTESDCGRSVQETSDGGYIIAGNTASSGAGGDDFWLVKTDSAGNEQWSKTYGGTEEEVAYSVQKTSDGGYIMAGDTCPVAFQFDFWLVKTDSAGNKQWSRTYGGAEDDFANSVQETSDGGFIIAGSTESFGAGTLDIWLVKTGDATPPSTVIDLAVSDPTSDSLTLTWTAPGDEWNKSTAKGYMVRYSTVGQINEVSWASATTLSQSWTPKANGTTETFVLSGLSSNTKYWFAIRAYDEASNYGGVSNSPSGTTLAAQAAGLSTELLAAVALGTVAVVAILALVLKKKK